METQTRLTEWRKKHNLAQWKAAQIMGVTPPCWSMWERGVRDIPQYAETIMRGIDEGSMSFERKMYYVYRTTNEENGLYYYGQSSIYGSPQDHKTYFGSSDWVKEMLAIGVKLKKEILFTSSEYKKASRLEQQLIKASADDAMCVNKSVWRTQRQKAAQ